MAISTFINMNDNLHEDIKQSLFWANAKYIKITSCMYNQMPYCKHGVLVYDSDSNVIATYFADAETIHSCWIAALSKNVQVISGHYELAHFIQTKFVP